MSFLVVASYGAERVGASPVTPAGSAAARGPSGSEGACTGDTGVTVVVDFQSLGGGVQVRCTDRGVGSGFDALSATGFAFEEPLRSPGFVCRLDGRPASDPCITTSPASAYWSYWVADRGGPWCYSGVGAASRRAPQGTIEGWSFSSGGGVSNAPRPRSGTFSALPGPQRLPTSECVRPEPKPPAQSTNAPSPAAPPAAVIPPSVGSATTLAPPSADAPPVPGATSPPDPDGGTTTAPGVTSTTTPDADAPGTEDVADPADGRTADEAAGVDASEDERTEESASSVELADSARNGPGSPLGTGVAVATMAVLGAAALLVNRRRLSLATQPPEET